MDQSSGHTAGALYQVICTGVAEGRVWRIPVSVHDDPEEAVLAASQYRSAYFRNFGFSNPHGRRWAVERIRPAAAFEVPKNDGGAGLVQAEDHG